MAKEQINIESLVRALEAHNILYRKGEPSISDEEFDQIEESLKRLDPANKYFDKIGVDPLKTGAKKVKLPIPMHSMHKIKTLKEIQNWIKRNNLERELFVLTPKFDGFAILADEIFKKDYSRGDGIEGNDITKLFNHTKEKQKNKFPWRYFGEGIILRKTFEQKYTKEILGDEGYENPRNMVASLFNPETKNPDLEKLKDVFFVRYGTDQKGVNKQEQIINCNILNRIDVPYKTCAVDYLTEDNLNSLFSKWNKDFELDGIIIDINHWYTRETLGRETNGNPKFARAFKGNFETIKETTIKSITWQTSKDGYLTPVAQIEPVRLDGATVDNVTLYNAKTVRDNRLGLFAKITVKRSGGVIPKFLEVIEPALEVKIPRSIDGVLTEWDDTEVELRLVKKTDKWRIQELLHFFRTFDIEEFGEPTVETLYNEGFNTVEKILMISEQQIKDIPGFGEKKAKFFLKEFNDKIKIGNPLEKIQAASNIFKGLGEKTLAIINPIIKDADTEENPLSNDEIKYLLTSIVGIGEKKANMYLDATCNFWQWYHMRKSLIPIKHEEVIIKESEKWKGQKVCFTGFRDIEAEKKIVANGGEIVSGVSKNTTLLVVKDLSSGSSKLQKAEDLGIKIIEKDKFKI